MSFRSFSLDSSNLLPANPISATDFSSSEDAHSQFGVFGSPRTKVSGKEVSPSEISSSCFGLIEIDDDDAPELYMTVDSDG